MTQKKLNICELLLYIHGKVMVAKQRVKYLNRKWENVLNHSPNTIPAYIPVEIAEIRKQFNEHIIRFPLDTVFILDMHGDYEKEVPEKVLEISNSILECVAIIGLADLGPKAYQGFSTELYVPEFENFCIASNNLFASLQELQNECEKSFNINIVDSEAILNRHFS